MPIYTMRNKNTGEIVEKIMTISAMEELREAGEW